MTTFDLIDHYQFEYISTLHRGNIDINCGCCSMVEEMNAIKVLYGKEPIRDVIEKCVCNRHGHQYCIPQTAVDDAVNALMDSMFVRADMVATPFINGNNISEVFEDFEELYDFISLVISGIPGIGPLTVYDTARRIGHLFSTPIYPRSYVYLAAGAKNGAEALLGKKGLRFREPIQLFESSFGTFPSIFIEDMLCIYEPLFSRCSVNPVSKEINIPYSYKNINSVSLKILKEMKEMESI
jgi:hypothetical protein